MLTLIANVNRSKRIKETDKQFGEDKEGERILNH